ncbi:flagellar hook-basal body complex protein FlhO [Paenibacillus cisolokensis]|uniref:Flagellar hook-basal body complex protein FlhO n=1 Tax=Paenibacillus cisolokensis TaxID=1658519 RepID=A0ABQ4N1D5_9BACL|nr:flagellar hook-basal body protein [Paenibacillus cisolokensis]GIQ61986.1 flagellar hook-basal body complex protein FlhO [Paenibacillus cisolokensis]
MLRGLYTAASGMLTQQRRHDTVTNNIANLNTPGYKQSVAVSRSFPEMLLSIVGASDQPNAAIGPIHTGVLAEESLLLHLQGDLLKTNRMSDFAIVSEIAVPGAVFDESGKYVTPEGETIFQPQAFFTVQNRDGEIRYTRGGQFVLTETGDLITPDGAAVLGEGGQPIRFEPGTSLEGLSLTADRQFVDAETGEPTGQRLLLTRIDDPNRLVREGDGKFRLNEEDAALARELEADDAVVVHQGYIERSNVDSAQSMVDMMAAVRAYEANQKVVQFYDRSLEKAANEVGRV